jgi:hypothetical protein
MKKKKKEQKRKEKRKKRLAKKVHITFKKEVPGGALSCPGARRTTVLLASLLWSDAIMRIQNLKKPLLPWNAQW